MRRIRHIVMWAGLAAIAALAALAIVGAFLKAEGARAMFNAVPLIVFWVLLGLLLAAGLVLFPRLLKRPAGLAMHLGALLVLAGAMWGSDRAHALRRDLFGGGKISRGFMAIPEGARENRVVGPGGREVAGELPFDLALRDFWIEYYEMPGRRWHLAVVAPVYGGDGRLVDRRQAEVEWGVGRPVDVPFTRAEVTVLRYLPHARPRYEEGAEPAVEITTRAGRIVRLPARTGAEVTLREPERTVRVVQVYENLRVEGSGEARRVVDRPGEGINPAVRVAVVGPDGEARERYVLALAPMHGRPGGPEMQYVFPEPAGARPDPESSVPAMQVRVSCGDRSMTRWLLPNEGDPYVALDLAPVVPGPGAGGDDGEGAAVPAEPPERDLSPRLVLIRPSGPVRDYYSDLAVIEDGKKVAEKTIEVNDPLHWGGYHFYQSDYDHEAGRYTVLQIVSDSGLWAVWLGMVLLVSGTFWRFWAEPVLATSEARKRRGETRPEPPS